MSLKASNQAARPLKNEPVAPNTFPVASGTGGIISRETDWMRVSIS